MTAAGSDGDQRLEFGILGPLEVLRSGTRLKLGGRQQRAILGLLLCEAGQVVSIGRLADALWGEHLPTGFVTTVQTYIFHLRALLEPDRARGAGSGVLVTEAGGGYRLHVSACTVDAVLFEDLLVRGQAALESQDPGEAVVLLDRALGLWRGEVLGDLADFGFVAPVAGRLQELRLSAMELRMEAELALGHHGTAVAELDRLVADHPLREQLHAERILALYRSGRQSEALAAYRQLRATLAEELGIEPSPPLHALHRAVLAQDPALAWHPAALVPVAAGGGGIGTDDGQERDAFRGSGHHAGPRTLGRPRLDGDDKRPDGFFGRFGGGSRRRMVAVWAAAVLVATGGAIVWLAHPTNPVTLATNSVGAVEPDGSISAAVQVGTNPVGLAFGGGALWVASRSDGRVSRLDPGTHTVIQTIDVGAAPEALTVTAGDVWVANFSDATVSRINIARNSVVQTIGVGTGPAAIGSGPSGVWVANSGDNTIQRIDPLTGRPDDPVGVGDGPDGIAVDAGSVWVANGRDGTLSRIDPRTGEELSSPVRVGAGPKGIALFGGDVWVANQLSTSVTRVNASTGVPRTIVVGDGPGSLVAAGGAVWVSEEFNGILSRIDPATNAVRRFSTGSSPRGLAVADGRLWVAAGAFADPKHRGGTLTVSATPAMFPGHEALDPATVYNPEALSAERVVYDGLVAFRLARGADSQVLVPNLAFTLPQPSNGGRTYTFTLRPGIKYSTGREVHASDFRLGVRRALTLKGGRPDFFTGIVGGQNCVDHPETCDLSSGVKTDDTTRTVTFHLNASDPEFVYKLTWFVYPTPPGTSPKEVTTQLPGTGPYKIAEYSKGKTFVLTRNPFFRQWSYAAQPQGYPDVIRWLAVADDKEALAAVTSGRADVAQPDLGSLTASPAPFSEFKVRYPNQFHPDLLAQTTFEHLNVTVPPFNNLKARQAVNYAVNRNTLVELWGGSSVGVATCQLLPPNFPGHKWYCPYTTGPTDGRYHGPDLAKARKLVDESGTKGMPVIVSGVRYSAFPAISAYFKEVLGQLGYKVTLRLMPDADPTWEFLHNPRNHVQVQPNGWAMDFPLASNFYDAVVACVSDLNLSEYCNRGLDQRAATATTLMVTDPGAALRAWTEIDRTITDEALIVPLFNTRNSTFVSARVGNYQSNQVIGALLSQLWVR